MFTTSHAVCPDNAFQDETPPDETPHRGAIALFRSKYSPIHSYTEILSFQSGSAAPYRISGELFVAAEPKRRSQVGIAPVTHPDLMIARPGVILLTSSQNQNYRRESDAEKIKNTCMSYVRLQ
jgi:hypothetical protein